jgi:hypothetical protein
MSSASTAPLRRIWPSSVPCGAERKAVHQQALEEAQLLAQLAYSKGEKYDPASDFPPEILQIGSDFSSAGIRRLIDRNQRLNQARHLFMGQPILPNAASLQ